VLAVALAAYRVPRVVATARFQEPFRSAQMAWKKPVCSAGWKNNQEGIRDSREVFRGSMVARLSWHLFQVSRCGVRFM
jgi:hypothetical protein